MARVDFVSKANEFWLTREFPATLGRRSDYPYETPVFRVTHKLQCCTQRICTNTYCNELPKNLTLE